MNSDFAALFASQYFKQKKISYWIEIMKVGIFLSLLKGNFLRTYARKIIIFLIPIFLLQITHHMTAAFSFMYRSIRYKLFFLQFFYGFWIDNNRAYIMIYKEQNKTIQSTSELQADAVYINVGFPFYSIFFSFSFILRLSYIRYEICCFSTIEKQIIWLKCFSVIVLCSKE